MRFSRRLGMALLLFGLSLGPALTAHAERSHRVRPGQTLAQIARRYRVHVSDLMAINRLGRRSVIRSGQTIRVPDRGAAYVRRGDTLSHVARRHGVSIRDLARANRMRVGAPLRVGQRLSLPGAVPDYRPRDWGEPDTPGEVRLVRGQRRATLLLRDEEGRVPRASLAALSELLRREGHDADEARDVAPRLALLVAALSDRFGGRPIAIVSGFRDADGHTLETSRHVADAAADIRVVGVPNRNVWERCRRLSGPVGCGFYPNSTFVHVDVRDERTQWVDWSHPGQRRRYGTLDGPARAGHRWMRFPSPDAALPAEVELIGPEPEGSFRADRSMWEWERLPEGLAPPIDENDAEEPDREAAEAEAEETEDSAPAPLEEPTPGETESEDPA